MQSMQTLTSQTRQDVIEAIQLLAAMPMPPITWVAMPIRDYEASVNIGNVRLFEVGDCQLGNIFYGRGVAIQQALPGMVAYRPGRERGGPRDPVLIVTSIDGETYYFQYQYSKKSGKWYWFQGVPRAVTPLPIGWTEVVEPVVTTLFNLAIGFGPLVGTGVAYLFQPSPDTLGGVILAAGWSVFVGTPLALTACDSMAELRRRFTKY